MKIILFKAVQYLPRKKRIDEALGFSLTTPNYEVTAFEKGKQNRADEFRDEVKKKVIHEALNDPKTINVYCRIWKNNNNNQNSLYATISPDEFGRYGEREDKWPIYEKTKLSVILKVFDNTDDGKLREFASVEDMIINSVDGHEEEGMWLCMGDINTDIDSFPNNVLMYLEVVADVKVNPIFENIPSFTKKMKEGDVRVSIRSREGTEIETYKSILSGCSEVMENMFDSEFRESLSNKLDMLDVSEKGLNAFVHYISGGDLISAKWDVKTAYELMLIGHKYIIPSLEVRSIEYLLERRDASFSVEQALEIFCFSTLTTNVDSGARLKDKVVTILSGEVTKLKQLQEYKDIFMKSPESDAAVELDSLFGKPDL